MNGRGGPQAPNQHRHFAAAAGNNSAPPENPQQQERAAPARMNGVHPAPHAPHVPAAVGRGFSRGGRGAFIPGFRGRGGIVSAFDRGRGHPHGRGFRGHGRGRGFLAPPLPS